VNVLVIVIVLVIVLAYHGNSSGPPI